MAKTSNIFARVEPEIKEQFDAGTGEGMEDIREDRVYTADTVEEEMRRDYGI